MFHVVIIAKRSFINDITKGRGVKKIAIVQLKGKGVDAY
jgi:hypothetical protein